MSRARVVGALRWRGSTLEAIPGMTVLEERTALAPYRIAALTPAEQAEATIAVKRWAGVATPTPARAAAPRVAALDSYNEALDRRVP